MVLYGICRQEKKRKRRRKVGNVSDIQTDQLLASTEMKVVCFYKDCVVASVRRGGALQGNLVLSPELIMKIGQVYPVEGFMSRARVQCRGSRVPFFFPSF